MNLVTLYRSHLHTVMYDFNSLLLASSMVGVHSFKYSFPNNISELYNVAVTCIIHPNSTANQCEVRAKADGRVTRIGK